MSVAITFCDETQHKCREYEYYNTLFGRSEAESLPRLIQFGTPVPFDSQLVSLVRPNYSADGTREVAIIPAILGSRGWPLSGINARALVCLEGG